MKKAVRKAEKQKTKNTGYDKSSCKMNRVSSSEEVLRGKAGDYCFEYCEYGDGTKQLIFYSRLPNNSYGAIPIRPVGPEAEKHWRHTDGKVHSWEWNGSEDNPTLKPSIRMSATPYRPGWHGYVTNGVMENCE